MPTCGTEAKLGVIGVSAEGLEALGDITVHGYEALRRVVRGAARARGRGRLGVSTTATLQDVAWTHRWCSIRDAQRSPATA